MNAYEEARERLDLADKAYRQIRAAQAALADAETVVEAEWAAANRNLRQYESKDGIPLPQYRVEVTV